MSRLNNVPYQNGDNGEERTEEAVNSTRTTVTEILELERHAVNTVCSL